MKLNKTILLITTMLLTMLLTLLSSCTYFNDEKEDEHNRYVNSKEQWGINYFYDKDTKLCFGERDNNNTENIYTMTCVPCTEAVLKKIYENDNNVVIVAKDTVYIR